MRLMKRLVEVGAVPATDRSRRGAWIFRDSTLRALAVLLDEAFTVPGTGIRFGIDGLIGLVPGLGDLVVGLLSLAIPVAAWVRGAPYVTLALMAANLAIDVAIGAIPVLGDAFDIAWKPNRRNYRLLMRHIDAPRRHGWRDWAFLLLLAAALGAVMVAPVAVTVWLVHWLWHGLLHAR